MLGNYGIIIDMKKHQHHCRCGFEKRLSKVKQRKNGKKLGMLGVSLFCLHILWHVAECLILPAVFVGIGGKVAGENVEAVENAPVVAEKTLIAPDELAYGLVCVKLDVEQQRAIAWSRILGLTPQI